MEMMMADETAALSAGRMVDLTVYSWAASKAWKWAVYWVVAMEFPLADYSVAKESKLAAWWAASWAGGLELRLVETKAVKRGACSAYALVVSLAASMAENLVGLSVARLVEKKAVEKAASSVVEKAASRVGDLVASSDDC